MKLRQAGLVWPNGNKNSGADGWPGLQVMWGTQLWGLMHLEHSWVVCWVAWWSWELCSGSSAHWNAYFNFRGNVPSCCDGLWNDWEGTDCIWSTFYGLSSLILTMPILQWNYQTNREVACFLSYMCVYLSMYMDIYNYRSIYIYVHMYVCVYQMFLL